MGKQIPHEQIQHVQHIILGGDGERVDKRDQGRRATRFVQAGNVLSFRGDGKMRQGFDAAERHVGQVQGANIKCAYFRQTRQGLHQCGGAGSRW